MEAYLDLLFDEKEYSTSLFVAGIDHLKTRLEEGAPNPAALKIPKHDTFYVAFSVNIGLEDLMSKRRILKLLGDALLRWQERHADRIKEVATASEVAG